MKQLPLLKNFNQTKLALISCAFVFFVGSFDSSVVAAAFPAISSTYNIPIIDLKNLMIGFLLSYTLAIPLIEYLVTKFGLRLIFMLACIGFMVSSLFCGITSSLDGLVIARSIQGFCAGCFTPISRILIVKTSTPQNLAINLTNIQTLGLLGAALGPFIGSYITTYLGWRYIFFINIPICLITLALIYVSIQSDKVKKTLKLDIIGYSYIVFILLVILVTSIYIEHNNGVILSVSILLIALLLIILAIKFSKHYFLHKQNPIINFKLLTNNIKFKHYSWCGIVGRQYVSAISFILIIIGGTIFNYNSLEIGQILLMYGAGLWASKIMTKELLKRFKVDKLLKINSVALLIFSIIGIWLVLYIKNIYFFYTISFIFGSLVSNVIGFYNVLAYTAVNKEDSIAAGTINSLIIYLSQSTAIAIFALFFHLFSKVFSLSGAVFTSILLLSTFLIWATTRLIFTKFNS